MVADNAIIQYKYFYVCSHGIYRDIFMFYSLCDLSFKKRSTCYQYVTQGSQIGLITYLRHEKLAMLSTIPMD